ncbi:MAG TPA: hypothetical protein DEF45_06080 [Rhodopirellula sp.]|nr:MAG: hypothetical protein CBD74_04260 [Saprospirales bacterium TMED214]HBV62574.1 hypothetical protein [Rhodopirellula sp.]
MKGRFRSHSHSGHNPNTSVVSGSETTPASLATSVVLITFKQHRQERFDTYPREHQHLDLNIQLSEHLHSAISNEKRAENIKTHPHGHCGVEAAPNRLSTIRVQNRTANLKFSKKKFRSHCFCHPDQLDLNGPAAIRASAFKIRIGHCFGWSAEALTAPTKGSK